MAEKVIVHVPTVLRGHVGDQARIELRGATVGEVLRDLMDRHPGLRGRLLDEEGELNRFINVYLNDEDVRFLDGLDSAVGEGDALMIVPAIAGGSGAGMRVRGHRPQPPAVSGPHPSDDDKSCIR